MSTSTLPETVSPPAESAGRLEPIGFARFAEPVTATTRLGSLDAYRGFIMLVMASGSLAIPGVVKELGKTLAGREFLARQPWWQWLAYQTDHVAWTGCSFWDLIQPSFMFMVGVALPYSYASRVAKGQKPLSIYGHALFRSLILVFLGVFLSSNWNRETNFTFVNVLSQIGLGYFFLYFLVGRGRLVQLLALAVILGGYGFWFTTVAPPGSDFDYYRVGVFGPEPFDGGLFAHWNKNTNAAAHFDTWFLNLWPQPLRVSPELSLQMGLFSPSPVGTLAALPFTPFEPAIGHTYFFNAGGYQTLNFIPSLGTMIFGLMAGELLRCREYTNIDKFLRLAFAGVILLVVGMVLSETVCPAVKRIWTPTWAIFSTGWTFLMLAFFYLVIDLWGFKLWSWPFMVVGMNSIAMYCMAQLLKPWTATMLKTHFGQQVFDGTYFGWTAFAPVFAPIAQAAAVLFVWWLICVWMYRQKIFIRI